MTMHRPINSQAPRCAPICGRAIVGPAAVDRAAFGLLGVEVRL